MIIVISILLPTQEFNVTKFCCKIITNLANKNNIAALVKNMTIVNE